MMADQNELDGACIPRRLLEVPAPLVFPPNVERSTNSFNPTFIRRQI